MLVQNQTSFEHVIRFSSLKGALHFTRLGSSIDNQSGSNFLPTPTQICDTTSINHKYGNVSPSILYSTLAVALAE